MRKKFELVLSDIILSTFVSFFSYWLINGTVGDINYYLVLVFNAIFIVPLILNKFYRFRIRNSSVELLKVIILPFVLSFLVVCLLTGILYGFKSAFFRWAIVNCIGSFGLVLISRVAYRLLDDEAGKIGAGVLPEAIIVGAGEVGSAIARQASKGRFDYKIKGFIDDNDELEDSIILGYPVLGKTDKLDTVLKKEPVDAVIVAISNLPSDKIHELATISRKNDVKIRIAPSLFEINGSKAPISVRDIDYADLLNRNFITIEKEPLFGMLGQKTILVTGAGGSIGSEICTQLMEYGPDKLILLDIDETELHDLALRLLNFEHEWSDKVIPVVCDIRNAEKIEQVFNTFKPDLVFHAAAYKHVPLMELYPEEAIITNICGSYNVFNSACKNNVSRVVVISTDKAVNPTNVMGATKRVVEMMAASFNNSFETDLCCVRFGNVIGSRGSMLPLFLEEIRAGRPITVTDRNIIRYFMAIPEAVSLVFRAAGIAEGGEVMVLDMGEPVNIYDFAQKLIDVFGDDRSKIRITGLRPGEKLYEELLADKDNTIPTEIPKVFRAKVDNTQFTVGELPEFVKNLKLKSQNQMVETLQEIVPEFHRTGERRGDLKSNALN